MIVAITRLSIAIKNSEALRTLLDQRMIIIHIITYIVYLISLGIYYALFAFWDKREDNQENKVFLAWGVATLLLFLVQLVLIYIFWSLSKVKSNSDESEDMSPEEIVYKTLSADEQIKPNSRPFISVV